MKSMILAIVCLGSMGCVNAHQNHSHSHTPNAPDSVKVRCAVKAEHPRACVSRWKAEHTYTHRHAGHGHHAHAKQTKVAVVIPVR